MLLSDLTPKILLHGLASSTDQSKHLSTRADHWMCLPSVPHNICTSRRAQSQISPAHISHATNYIPCLKLCLTLRAHLLLHGPSQLTLDCTSIQHNNLYSISLLIQRSSVLVIVASGSSGRMTFVAWSDSCSLPGVFTAELTASDADANIAAGGVVRLHFTSLRD